MQYASTSPDADFPRCRFRIKLDAKNIASNGEPNMSTTEMTNAVERTVDYASTSAHKAIDKASAVTRPAVDELTSGAHHAVDRLAGSATHVAESLEVKGEELQALQGRLTESCRTHLRDHPVATIGIAVAAGYMLNWWLKQR